MIASETVKPAKISIIGDARLATRAILLDSLSTPVTLTARRRRISSSSPKALTMRRPCKASCMVSTIRVPPVICVRAMPRTRRTILRSRINAGGAMMRPAIDMIGSSITITKVRPISDIRSRPTAVMSRLMVWLTAAAPVDRRTINSEECRSAKKPIFSCNNLSNMRCWLSATMRLPIQDSQTADA